MEQDYNERCRKHPEEPGVGEQQGAWRGWATSR